MEPPYNYSMENVIEREFIEIVKELKEMGESDKEGIINLSKDNMMTNVSMILDDIENKVNSLFD
tara:strand:- start:685 stop:876 length:192 start_codon:yes stop_codon:yes gene_type:complete